MSEFIALIPSDSEPEEHTLQRDKGRPVVFNGYKLRKAGTGLNSACSDYSGSAGRCHVYSIYVTQKGSLVIYSQGITQWGGERNRYSVEKFSTKSVLIAWLDAISIGRAEQDLIETLDDMGLEMAEKLED
jgi:hypothetical protein